jgi:predicted O-methyltransferase YrrM
MAKVAMASNRIELAWNEYRQAGEWFVPDPATFTLYKMLYHWCEYIKAKQIVEVGIGRAFGVYAFGLYAKEHDASYTCIDVAQHCATRAHAIKDFFDLPVDVLQYDSKAISWRKRIDFLFIDGGHSYEQVLADIDRYVPWVRKNGLVFFHCYLNKRHEVKRAVDERYDESKHDAFLLPYNSLGVRIWRIR